RASGVLYVRNQQARRREDRRRVQQCSPMYRVIQWSTGNVGRYALRGIIGHPELELAGLWVHSAGKQGRDAGELCGLGPVGVTATTDAGSLLGLDDDCVSYTAPADLSPPEAVDD